MAKFSYSSQIHPIDHLDYSSPADGVVLAQPAAILEMSSLWMISGSRGIRTPDSRIKSPVLYLAEP